MALQAGIPHLPGHQLLPETLAVFHCWNCSEESCKGWPQCRLVPETARGYGALGRGWFPSHLPPWLPGPHGSSLLGSCV